VGVGQKSLAARDQRGIPPVGVLLVERHESTVRIPACAAPRFAEAYQRREAGGLGLIGQQLGQQQGKLQRLCRQRVDRRAISTPVPVDRVGAVDRFQHGREAAGQLIGWRDREGNTRIANASLRPDESLGHGRRDDCERLRDGRRVHPQDGLKHQWGADIGGYRGMRAHQQQLEPPIRQL
jgi:hypothetical protein